MYSYNSHFGGILLRDLIHGKEVFLQPGDDSIHFYDEIEKAESLDESKAISRVQEIISDYFHLID